MTCSSLLEKVTSTEKSESLIEAELIFEQEGPIEAIAHIEMTVDDARYSDELKSLDSDTVMLLFQLHTQRRDSSAQIKSLLLFLEITDPNTQAELFSLGLSKLAREYERSAREHQDNELFKKAIQVRLTELELNSENYAALKGLIHSYTELGVNDKVLQYIDRLYSAAINNGFLKASAKVLHQKVKAQLALKKITGAVETLAFLYEKHDDKAWALPRLTSINLSQRNYEKALEQANELLEVTNGTSNIAPLQIVQAYIGLNRMVDAEAMASQKVTEAINANKTDLAASFQALLNIINTTQVSSDKSNEDTYVHRFYVPGEDGEGLNEFDYSLNDNDNY